MSCLNCGKLGHFALDCTEPKVIYDQIHFHNTFVSSCLMLAETVLYWTLDSAETDHIARDHNTYVDLCRIMKGSRNIYMGNNTSIGVPGIGTCKLFVGIMFPL